MSLRWDKHFLASAALTAKMSKDPSTKIGAIIVGPDKEVRSSGFNGFPRGILDSDDRLNNRELKYKLVVHAEMNAVLAAARVGIPLKGCTIYVADSERRMGGCPCIRCTVECLQAGIETFVGWGPLPQPRWPGDWLEDSLMARSLIEEAGAIYREVEKEK